jgi:hypothetical protein
MTLPDPISHLSWQQLLAAYADDQLDEATRCRVRSWIDAHQSARRELDGQFAFSQRRAQLWNDLQATQPSDAAWAGVWERIEFSLESPRTEVKPRQRRRWLRRGIISGLLVAPCSAAVALCLTGPAPVTTVEQAVDEPTPEVFQVAAADDVEILSVRDSDAASLLVGQPPLCGKMTLAARGDVKFEFVGASGNAASSEVQMDGPTDAPLVHAPKMRTP